jgi:hypothetical protein
VSESRARDEVSKAVNLATAAKDTNTFFPLLGILSSFLRPQQTFHAVDSRIACKHRSCGGYPRSPNTVLNARLRLSLGPLLYKGYSRTKHVLLPPAFLYHFYVHLSSRNCASRESTPVSNTNLQATLRKIRGQCLKKVNAGLPAHQAYRFFRAHEITEGKKVSTHPASIAASRINGVASREPSFGIHNADSSRSVQCKATSLLQIWVA